jgi:preprotein translocase subunit SecY
LLGIIFISADLLGALGSGSGLLLAVSTIAECYEELIQDPEFTSKFFSVFKLD